MLLSEGLKHSRPSSRLHAVTGMAAGQIANRSLARYITQGKGHHKVIMQLIQLMKIGIS